MQHPCRLGCLQTMHLTVHLTETECAYPTQLLLYLHQVRSVFMDDGTKCKPVSERGWHVLYFHTGVIGACDTAPLSQSRRRCHFSCEISHVCWVNMALYQLVLKLTLCREQETSFYLPLQLRVYRQPAVSLQPHEGSCVYPNNEGARASQTLLLHFFHPQVTNGPSVSPYHRNFSPQTTNELLKVLNRSSNHLRRSEDSWTIC